MGILQGAHSPRSLPSGARGRPQYPSAPPHDLPDVGGREGAHGDSQRAPQQGRQSQHRRQVRHHAPHLGLPQRVPGDLSVAAGVRGQHRRYGHGKFLVQTKDYCITGHATPISCTVGLR